MKIIALLALGALSLCSCTSADGGISKRLTEQFDASSSAPLDIAKLGIHLGQILRPRALHNERGCRANARL